MNDLNLDKYLNIANEEKTKRGLETYIPLYPMLRNQDGKLYIGILLTEEKDNVWSTEEQIKPEYWILIDINTDEIVEFNKTSEYDFMIGSVITKNSAEKQQDIFQYKNEKTRQYRNYLIEDIKNAKLPLQKEISNIMGNELEIEGEKININDYLISNLEKDIERKISELVSLLIQSKYGSITFYYGSLFNGVIDSYKNNNSIDKEKMELCIEIINYYYDGVIGIDNFFNI